MSRTLNAVRMQLVNKETFIWVPLLVLAGSLLLSIAVYALIPYDGVKAGGGSQAPLWYFLVVGTQALTRTFPFSQAMSVTRREFYIGTLLTAIGTSAMLAIIFVLGGLVEQATRGWGVNGYFFYLEWLWVGGPWAALLEFFVAALLFFMIGFWGATIFKRFGTLWLTVILIGVGVLLVGAVFLVTYLEAWEPVWIWIFTTGAVGLAAWGLAVAAVLAVISYLSLRRAIP